MKPTAILFGFFAACAAPLAPQQSAISPETFQGFDLSGAHYAIYLEGQEDYDANGDGQLDSTFKYLQVLLSDHPNLCHEYQTGASTGDIRMGYTTAAYYGPIGEPLPDLYSEDLFVGDYTNKVWVDQGLFVVYNGRIAVNTAGYGDGSLQLDLINDIGEPFIIRDWINDIGEPMRSRGTPYVNAPVRDTINDIGEPLADLPSISDIGEPLRGFAQGEMHYDTSGASLFDLDLDRDGVKDATQLSPTPLQLSIRDAKRCDLTQR